MICLRCGYCCKHSFVVIIDDPEQGYDPNDPDCQDNMAVVLGDGTPCKHLRGEKPGEYYCAIHDKPWYKHTPCAKHQQIEQKNSNCRMGEYILSRENQEGRK